MFLTIYSKILNIIRSKTFENITSSVGALGQTAGYIQGFKIIYLQSSYAVSLTSSILGLVSMIIWLIYGMGHGIKPLIISNIFGIGGAILVVFGILYYG